MGKSALRLVQSPERVAAEASKFPAETTFCPAAPANTIRIGLSRSEENFVSNTNPLMGFCSLACVCICL